jgi:hypothetical protein
MMANRHNPTKEAIMAKAPKETPVTEAPEAEVAEATEVKTTKSIVPSKYSGRYKNGGEDPLAQFIKAQCTVDGNFSFDKFFELMSANGIAQDKVDHYKNQVAEKRHGAEGRARMTLRNMLATFVRKNGKAIGLDGSEVAINLPKPALTGAAKAAAESATSTQAEAEAA